MARKATTRSRRKATAKKEQGLSIRPEFIGTVLLLMAGITLLSLFAPNQSALMAGWLDFLQVLIGWGGYIIWFPLFLLALWLFRGYDEENRTEQWEKPIGTIILLLLVLVLFHLIEPGDGLLEPGRCFRGVGGLQ